MNWNWAYAISGTAAEIALLMSVYHFTARRSDTTIKALEVQNKSLEKALEEARTNAPDFLAKVLSERIAVLEAELKRLFSDREMDKAVVKDKELELEKTKTLLVEVNQAVAEFEKRYETLKRKANVCPFCESPLQTRVYLEPSRPESGAEETFGCGYKVIVGPWLGHEPDAVVTYCSSNPNYPKLDEKEILLQQNILLNGEWFAFVKIDKVARIEVVGNSKEDAVEKLKKRYYAKYPFIGF